MPKTPIDIAAGSEQTEQAAPAPPPPESSRQEDQGGEPPRPSGLPLRGALDRLKVILEKIAPYPIQGG